jgi:hypothetical protein
MGAGKSVCGRLLARRLGRCFVETDDMIVGREGIPIPEIFARHGEARFRQLEAEAVEALALKSGDVIATGGGLPCREGRMEACARSAPCLAGGEPAPSTRAGTGCARARRAPDDDVGAVSHAPAVLRAGARRRHDGL